MSMFYGFRIRPLVRLFWAAVLVWMAYLCFYTARFVPAPALKAAFLMIMGGLFLLGAFVVLRGLWRVFRAYGRTWIG
jgi:hypothetical protein